MDLGEQVESLQRQQEQSGTGDVPLGTLLTEPWKDQLRRAKKKFSRDSHKRREPIFFILWLGWLFVGTMFYSFAPKSALGIIKGFYMAINIGYSIGFGFPSEDPTYYLFFSSIYVLLGASFVGVALGFFAEKITKDTETWFTRMQHEKEIEEAIKAKVASFQGSLQAWIYHNSKALKAVSSWLTIIIIMITYSMISVKWPFREAQYFAVSTLSTGGHWPIPAESPDWLFGVTALLTMIGVPVMGVAMAEIAQVLISQGDVDEAKETIDAAVTKEELEFLQELGLEDFDGKVDKSEFIILCMVRMGTDPGLIKYITQRFAELNFYTGEALTVAEITQGRFKFVSGRIRRAESVKGDHLKVVSEHDYVVPEGSNSYLDYYYRSSDDDSSSRDSYGGPHVRKKRLLPALPTVEEELRASEHKRKQEEAFRKPKESTKQSASAPYKRATSLDLNDVFNTTMDISGRSSASSSQRERMGTAKHMKAINGTTGENHLAMDSSGLSVGSSSRRRQRRDTARPFNAMDMSNSNVEQNVVLQNEGTGVDHSTMECSSLVSFATSSHPGKREVLRPLGRTEVASASSREDERRKPKPPQNVELLAMEEGRADDDCSSERHQDYSGGADPFADEAEEGSRRSRRPMVFRRFHKRLKEECSKPSTLNFNAHIAGNEAEDECTDGSTQCSKQGTMNVNYGDIVFGHEKAKRVVDLQQSNGGSLQGRLKGTNAQPQEIQASVFAQAADLPSTPNYDGLQSSSQRSSASATEDFEQHLSKKSYSSYLRR